MMPKIAFISSLLSHSLNSISKQGACHFVALPFTIKTNLKAKEKNYVNPNISPWNYNSQKTL
jgi:hypothetical protein